MTIGGKTCNLTAPKRAKILRICTGFLVFGIIVSIGFEIYFQSYRCTVSNSYYEKNLKYVRRNAVYVPISCLYVSVCQFCVNAYG